MVEDIVNGFAPEVTQIIAESRILAINAKHGFIGLEHFFAALLTVDCQAQSYLKAFEAEKYIVALQKVYANTGTQTMEDSLPLTIHAERIIRQAVHIASKEKAQTNSVHLLLAMLSYDNQVSERVKKAGIIFEDIAANYIKSDLPKMPIELELRHFSKPSRIGSFLRLAPSMKKLLEDIHSHADSLWVYQQYDDCITTCKTGLEFMPDHHGLKALLAHSFLKKRDYKNAIIHFHELLNVFPDDLNFQLALSFCYDDDGDHQKAEEILDNMLARKPDDVTILNNKGFCLYRQSRYAEAAPFYEKAIQIDPLFAYPWDNLGFIKYKLGDTAQAITLIDKALELDKGNAYAYKYKGIVFMEQQNKTLAMENFQLALKYGYTKTYGEEVLQLIEKCK